MSDLRFFDIIQPGNRVDFWALSEEEIDTENDGFMEEKKFSISKVYDVDDDENIHVFMPVEKLKTILVPLDVDFRLYFYCKHGIYTCEARCIERYKEDSVMVAVFEPYTSLSKQQRREYYRYSCIIGMNTRKLSEAEDYRFHEQKNAQLLAEPQDKSVIVDISGGGMRFVSRDKYDDSSLVHCRFMLEIQGKSKIYDVVVRVISSYPVANNKSNTEYRCQFLYIPTAEREEIIKFIFEQERKLRHGRY